ncbi:enoyl-CoA hydratase/isomerase family protein [Patulibacter minatonensis]|uniref:enoyl-CoA hydratase/isomerase family protein n=1 Tax=Patulibacter minatonensis TaxID=298163 RepID=UPI000478D0B3|nr:enoyl-CoA hydratase-related protein [Patulibacter minatonensis]
MSVDPPVRFELEDGVGHVVLARPDRRNAVDVEAAVALRDALGACADTPGVRAVLIRAEGEHFSVGGDLAFLARDPDRLGVVVREILPPVQEASARVAELRVPVVCAARGGAAGVALGLLWGADVAIVADDVRIATGFAAVGLSGDGGSSWHLPRLCGLRRAQELLMQNRRIGAEEAVEWGLVSRAVPAADLESTARAAALELAAGPTVALGRMRALLRSGSPSLREHLAAESEAILACAATDDLPAAIVAFSGGRAPVFTGT